jgi:hypothetical protein
MPGNLRALTGGNTNSKDREGGEKMKSRITRSSLSVVLAVALLAGMLGCLGEEEQQEGGLPPELAAELNPTEWKWLESENWGFRVKYPAEWEGVSVETNSFMADYHPKGIREIGINLLVTKARRDLDEEMIFFVEEDLPSDAKIIIQKDTTLDGVRASLLVYNMGHDLIIPEEVIREAVTCVKDGVCYELDFTYFPDQRPARLIKEVKDSWRWIE